MNVTADAFFQTVHNGEAGRDVGSHDYYGSHGWVGVSRSGLILASMPIDRGVFVTSVVSVYANPLVIVDAVAVFCCQHFGIAVGDGQRHVVHHLVGCELMRWHSLVTLQHGGRRIDEGNVACRRVEEMPTRVQIHVVDVPLVGVAQDSVFVVIVEAAQIAESETESFLKILGVAY